MPSLSQAYERREVDRQRRVAVGGLVFVLGVAAVAAAILLATTSLSGRFGFGTDAARLRAGLLAGVGVPALFGGLVAVLPTGRSARLRAAMGIGLTLAAVVAFWRVYPNHWLGAGGAPVSLTAGVLGLYALGALAGLWAVFGALATFSRRNDPAATVTLEVTRNGETRTVELSPEEVDRRDLSSIAAEAHSE
jgi:hypothetical protein